MLLASAGRPFGKLARIVLYAYVVLIACPIRYWPLESDIDATWRFALNYASAQGPVVASETVFTMGPLGYLLFPQHVGGNLAQGLRFQAGLWVLLAAIFADIFFLAGFPLRNLALFSLCFTLATPLFWFDSIGTENLMLSAALLLVIMFHLRGSWLRYLVALVLVGLLPMFKMSSALIGVAALAGFLIERVIDRRSKALKEAALAVIVPAAVAIIVCICVMPSIYSVLNYLRGSVEIVSGYSSAMSVTGPSMGLISAMEAVGALAALLWFKATYAPKVARFYVLLLAIPLFLSFKHGFVRQDVHVINFFCFAGLALSLVALTEKLDRASAIRAAPLVILFFVIWQDNVSLGSFSNLIAYPSGVPAARMIWGALRYDKLKQRLDSSMDAFPEDSRIEPEVVGLIGDSPVASLSYNFTNVAAARMQLKLYPVVQRYAAFTPYLDGLNAAWIRDQGPRFLIFDGKAIDGRDPWAETPAMWLEIYRWYDARFLGPRNLLLERRAGPRFIALETIGRFRMAIGDELRFPVSSDAVFWKMKCNYSMRGQVQKLLFHTPSVLMSVHEEDGISRFARVIPEVLVSPVMGNHLPGSLAQFYAVFHPGVERGYSVDQVRFKISSGTYLPSCEVEMLRAAR